MLARGTTVAGRCAFSWARLNISAAVARAEASFSSAVIVSRTEGGLAAAASLLTVDSIAASSHASSIG
jgi:hypothetical protein